MEAGLTKQRSRGFPAEKSRSAAQIGAHAHLVRRTWYPALADDTAFDALDFFSTLHRRTVTFKGRQIPIDTDVQSFGPTVEGVTDFDARNEKFVLCLSETTYTGLCAGDPRARFTLAHEVGHLCLHRSEMLTLRALGGLDRVMARETARHPIYLDTEWQADTFAGRLLVPDAGLWALLSAQRLDETQVVHRFGVSHAAARTRLDQFERERGGRRQAS